jgi:hypothetical protein
MSYGNGMIAALLCSAFRRANRIFVSQDVEKQNAFVSARRFTAKQSGFSLPPYRIRNNSSYFIPPCTYFYPAMYVFSALHVRNYFLKIG